MFRRSQISLLMMLATLCCNSSEAEERTDPSNTFIRYLDAQNGGFQLDLGPQVLKLDVPERRGGTPQILLKTPPVAVNDDSTLPVALLVQKAKQFDDGLYATVELAAQQGAGTFSGKSGLLTSLAKALAEDVPDIATVTIEAASQLGGAQMKLPNPMHDRVKSAIRAFDLKKVASKPIGFYTWSPELSAIFRQDRMLQSTLEGQNIAHIIREMHGNPDLRRTYEAYLALTDQLTNPPPPEKPDLRHALAQLDAGTGTLPTKEVYFFPPSRAHETDLLKRLYPMGIPEGVSFSLIDEMMQQLRAGKINLTPTATSGWYDWSTWALETLAVPERATETNKLQLGDAYRKTLAALFQGALALTRETHIKQLETMETGAAMRPPASEIRIAPRLRVEPLATYYLRRALGYRFVERVLTTTFGAEALKKIHRIGPEGPATLSLADELTQMQALFFGAYAVVCEDLGLRAEAQADAAANAPVFLNWKANAAADADLQRDARMMVPLFQDLNRSKIKVLVFLGWQPTYATAIFVTPPSVIAATSGAKPKLQFVSATVSLLQPVTAEIYVDKLLDRDEFRALCDTHRTSADILQALQ